MVGLCALCLPQVPPRVNPCDHVNSTNVFSCARVGLVLDYGVALCLTRGGGVDLCLLLLYPLRHKKGAN